MFIRFIHRPLQPLRQRAAPTPGLLLERMVRAGAARRLPGPGPRVRGGRHHPPAPVAGRAGLRDRDGRAHRTRRLTRERVRRDHRAVRGRSLAGGRQPRGPRLVRDRQPAAGAHPQGGRAGASPGSTHANRVVLVVGTGPLPRGGAAGARRPARPRAAACAILFLEASTDVLVRRYESTRRRHPAGRRRRAWPRPSSRAAAARAGEGRGRRRGRHQRPQRPPAPRAACSTCSATTATPTSMQTTVMSFGYKHGLPLDVDLVIDCRFLPNPHWVDELRPLTGLDDAGAATTCSARTSPASSSTSSTACSSCCCPPTCARARRT